MDDCVRLKVPGQRETQSSDPAGPQLHNSTGSCPHGGRATFYNLHNGVLQVRGGPT